MTLYVHDHTYKPNPIFYGTAAYDETKLYLGIELEVECQNSVNQTVTELSRIRGISSENEVYLKSDGSLRDGFEVVSHPRTMSSHKYFKWQKIAKSLIAAGAQSHDSPRCGLHVHFNKSYLTARQQTKFAFWIYSQTQLMDTVSRRSANHYCQAMFPQKMSASQVNEPTRYYKVNKHNLHTIEIRQFKGTLKYSSFMAALEFVAASVNFIIACPVHYLANQQKALECFLGYLSGTGLVAKKYSHLIKFLRTAGYTISDERVVWYKLNDLTGTTII